jgi:hypothetical protein
MRSEVKLSCIDKHNTKNKKRNTDKCLASKLNTVSEVFFAVIQLQYTHIQVPSSGMRQCKAQCLKSYTAYIVCDKEGSFPNILLIPMIL